MNRILLLLRERPGVVMAALLIGWGIVSIGWGERLLRADGFGWDGTAYRDMTQLWPNEMPKLSVYTGHRCLPSLVVHYSLKALGRPLDGPDVLMAFSIYNLLLYVLILYLLLACADALGLDTKGKWLLFGGFFLNYVHLKQHYYSACVTDVWALAASAFALLAYLKRWTLCVALATIAGSFAWPAMLPLTIGFLVFPRRSGAATEPTPAPYGLNVWAAGALTLLVVGGAYYLVFVELYYGVIPTEVVKSALAISLVCLAAFLYHFFRPLFDFGALYDWRTYIDWRAAVGCVLVVATVKITKEIFHPIEHLFPSPYLPLTPLDFIRRILVTSVAKPLLFGVGHVVWYGPVILIAAFLWKEVCALAQRVGVGLVVALAAGGLMGINPESRASQAYFPIVALLTAWALQDRIAYRGQWVILLVYAILMSHVWLPLNRKPWPEADLIYDFPMQRFFMHFGGYMINKTYLILGGTCIYAGVVLWFTVFRPEPFARGTRWVFAKCSPRSKPTEAGAPA